MRSTKVAIDPLWQCLCPAWPLASSSITNLRILSRAKKPVFQCLNKPRFESSLSRLNARSRHFDAVYDPARGVQTSKAYYEQQPPPRPDGKAGRDGDASQNKLSTYVSKLEEESTHFLYGQLRSAAIEGRFRPCRAIAEYLVKERGEKPSVQLYNALILSNISHDFGSAWRASELLEEMQAEGLQPDSGTCHAILKVVAVHVDHLLRSDVLEYMRTRWYTLSADGAHDVCAGALREGLFEQALEQLDKMRSDGTKIEGWLEDMAIYVLCEAGEIDEAYRIMRVRYDAGHLHLSRSLWMFLLDKGSEARHHDATSLVWTSQVNQGYLNPSSGICLNVLATASRSGDAALGTEVFEHLSKCGTAFQPIHYELLITTYLAADPPDLVRAISILTIMPLERLEPTQAETRSLYMLLRTEPALVQRAFNTLRDLHEEGRTIPIAALNLLIECYVEQNNLPEAMKIYKLIHTFVPIGHGAQKSFANIETFNLLFKACRTSTPPDSAEASFLVSELLALRVTPIALTYDRLILVFLESAKAAFNAAATSEASDAQQSRGEEMLDWAFRHFADMQQLRWLPRFGTIETLALELAQQGNARCWDVLQIAEDRAHEIEGFSTRCKWARPRIEKVWRAAKDAEEGGSEGIDEESAEDVGAVVANA